MRNRKRRGRRLQMPEVSLTPLIDTALTLLVIFMITAPMVQYGIKVDLPQGKSKEVATQQELVVSIHRNGTMYSSYTASSFARIYELMDLYNVNLKGVVSWSFEFEDQEWFAGFRELATHGIDKPVLNVFRMFGVMNGTRVSVTSDNDLKAADIIANGVRERNDISAMATMSTNSICVMVWNYNDDDIPGASSLVKVKLKGISKDQLLLQHYRVDQQFSNSFEAWKKLGRPQSVTAAQYEVLEQAGQLQGKESPRWIKLKDGVTELELELPRQGVSLLRMTW